jgi:hypothetical protein
MMCEELALTKPCFGHILKRHTCRADSKHVLTDLDRSQSRITFENGGPCFQHLKALA